MRALATFTLMLVPASCGSDPTPASSHEAPPASPPAATAPTAPEPATPVRPPVVATDVIGHYSQYLAWLQDLRRSVPANGPTPTLGRTMRIEADGTVTIVDDANGEVRAHGTWTVESDTVVLTMAEGTLLGTLQGKELTVSVRSAEMQHATTWHRKK